MRRAGTPLGLALLGALSLVLLLAACATRPVDLRDTDEAPSSARSVIGRLDLTARLPDQSNFLVQRYIAVAIGRDDNDRFSAVYELKLAEDQGWFHWHLAPGDYVIRYLNWSSQILSTSYSFKKRVWARFSVPATAKSVYIGTLTLNPTAQGQFVREAEVSNELAVARTRFADAFGVSEPQVSLMQWKAPR